MNKLSTIKFLMLFFLGMVPFLSQTWGSFPDDMSLTEWEKSDAGKCFGKLSFYQLRCVADKLAELVPNLNAAEREQHRRLPKLRLWFVENWEMIQPVADYIHIDDSLSPTSTEVAKQVANAARKLFKLNQKSSRTRTASQTRLRKSSETYSESKHLIPQPGPSILMKPEDHDQNTTRKVTFQ